jgi:hypothetical protein
MKAESADEKPLMNAPIAVQDLNSVKFNDVKLLSPTPNILNVHTSLLTM